MTSRSPASYSAAGEDGPPWETQLTQTIAEPWSHGRGILGLSAVLLAWFASLTFRFTSGPEQLAALAWLAGACVWFGLQIVMGRTHLPEKVAFLFPTILQAVLPVIGTVACAVFWPEFRSAAMAIAANVSVIELVAIHILRLAAWGTIAKYLAGQLPVYFYRFASLPDFGFAILAVLATIWIGILDAGPSPAVLHFFNIIGAVAFLGAAITMYFGVPGSALSYRWPMVEEGTEAPTYLPFRWPMNLAPAFCGPAFWIAHALLFLKLSWT